MSQAVAIGDRRPYLVALLTLDPVAPRRGSGARRQLRAHAGGGRASDPVFRAYLEKQVEEVNQGLARYETIKKIAILPRELVGRGGRAHADAQAQAPGDPRAPQGRDRSALRVGRPRPG